MPEHTVEAEGKLWVNSGSVAHLALQKVPLPNVLSEAQRQLTFHLKLSEGFLPSSSPFLCNFFAILTWSTASVHCF